MPNVRIRIERGVETAGDGLEQQESLLTKQQKKQVSVATLFAKQIINNTKQIVKAEINRIGSKTGDYIKQANANAALDVVGEISTLATGAFLSVKTMNPIPIIAASASIGMKYGQKIADLQEEYRHANIQYEYMQIRSGNATTNGSRGTEN